MGSDEDFSFIGSDDSMDVEDSFDEEVVNASNKGKGKGKGKKTTENSTNKGDSPSANTSESTTTEKRKSLAIEQKYQKMTQREHIIKRPDTYIGSVEKLTQEMWVYDRLKNGLVYKNITYVPGFYKIFDEILVNAADNKQNDPSMDTIKVTIDKEGGRITVWNNGKGIPVVIHKDYNIYVPSLIFGQLLTGGNFNDDEKKVTGGRNGYGAKLTNIYSTEFKVETADSKEGKKFVQVWHDNMSIADDPHITSYRGKEYTEVSYKPDLKLFGMDCFDDDIVALMEKRVYDMAGVTDSSLKVYLNGERIAVKNFEQYIKMYQNESASNTKDNKIAYIKAGDRWEIGVGVSDGHLQQVSFVNSICTSKGGKHVDYIAQKIVDYLTPIVKRKTKKDVKPMMIKQYLYIFVNCMIENPAFDSQTKETLTTVSKKFGSLPELTDNFLAKVAKCGIVESVSSFSRFKDEQMLKKQSGTKTARKLDIPKLDDANYAGTRQSKDCTLIITEGDSAKSLVVGGLSIIGRDYYGVFPLRGKMLNVRDESKRAVLANEEIKNLVQILGLKYDTVYKDVSSLRYGKLVIMADQDYDGSHIKGLVINFIEHFWPSLLKLDFLQQFITPIVKATKLRHSHMFFTLQQFKNWLEANNQGKGYHIKYYKGLGTSTPVEGKEYFSNLQRHLVPFHPITTEESSQIDMVFRKSRVAERKDWINNYHSGDYVDYAVDAMAYKDFIDKELILFSRYDNTRSIPCVVDGLKPSQRKVLFGAFKRKLYSEIKVMQFSGYVSEHTAYHHGEQSLNSTIIGMAQDFVGSNNINLLVPNGQFGTRLLGGKDAASPRYIYTLLSKITRMIFKEEDDFLCRYLVDEGQSIEPEYYLPILPMVLVNGSEGIGTGYSTTIPNYNPIDIVNYIKAKLNNTALPEIHPWWRGFTGDIYKIPNGYLIRGRISKLDDLTYVITELPIGRWTQDYKKFLTELAIPEKKTPVIADFKENHTDTTVHFTIILTPEQAKELEGKDLYKFFKLETTIKTTNFNLFDENGHIHHYDSPQAILDSFFDFRYPLYQKRKDYLIEKMEKEMKRLSNLARFVLAVVNRELIISNRPRKSILQDLVKMGFDTFYSEEKKLVSEQSEEVVIQGEKQEEEPSIPMDEKTRDLSRGYEYLLKIRIDTLTKERVEELKRDLESCRQQLEDLKNTTTKTMWENDLDAFVEELLKMEQQRMKEKKMEEKNRKIAEKNRRAGHSKNSRRSITGFSDEEISDDDDDDDEDDDKPSRRKKTKAAPAVRLTAKEKKIDEITKRANEVKSRFSISSYYTSQVKEAPADLLESMSMTVDPETGEIVKVTKRAKKQEGEGKTTTKKGKAVKVKKEDEMVLESDSDGSEDSEDDVIRDNRAAIMKKMEESQQQEGMVEEKEEEEVKPKRGRKPAVKKEEGMIEEKVEEEKEKEEKVEEKVEEEVKPKRGRKPAAKKEDDDDEEETKPKRGRKPAAKKPVEKKEDESTSKPTSQVKETEIMEIESDGSEEDTYVPLAERLKSMSKDDSKSKLVDELASTKSVVPATRKRKAPTKSKTTEEAPKKRVKTKKADSESSDDSLFGF